MAQVEARLRANLANMRSERDAASSQAAESERKAELLADELQLTKLKLGRVSKEKIKIERESRAMISRTRSLENTSSSSVDFYKRKSSELTSQLSAQHALSADQKHQIDELRRQLERHLSQNRLANLRAGDRNSRSK